MASSSPAFGTGTAFAVDAASFAASPWRSSSSALRRTRARSTPTSSLQAVKEGLRFVRAPSWLWGTLLSATIAYLAFMGPAEVLLPYVVKNELHASAGDLGLVFAAGGIGAIGAALIMGQRGHPRRDVTFMYATWTLATLAVAGYGLATSSWQLMVACLLFNALETAGHDRLGDDQAAPRPGLHARARLQPGLADLDRAAAALLRAHGPVAGLVGVRATLIGAAIIGTVATLGALFLPGMRDIEGEAAEQGPEGRRREGRPAQPAGDRRLAQLTRRLGFRLLEGSATGRA